MRTEFAPSYPVSIFIAGDYHMATRVCRAFCDEVGLCVTVTATAYCYTDGAEAGVIVGLINYPRFPAQPRDIIEKAESLADRLRLALGQESYSIQTPDETLWHSWRAVDLASGTPLREDPEEGLRAKPGGPTLEEGDAQTLSTSAVKKGR